MQSSGNIFKTCEGCSDPELAQQLVKHQAASLAARVMRVRQMRARQSRQELGMTSIGGYTASTPEILLNALTSHLVERHLIACDPEPDGACRLLYLGTQMTMPPPRQISES